MILVQAVMETNMNTGVITTQLGNNNSEVAGKIDSHITIIETKYPSIVKACVNQQVPLHKVFARIEDTDHNGYDNASYPLVKLSYGKIPMTSDGHILYDSGNVNYAFNMANMYNASGQVKAAIKDAMSTLHTVGMDHGNSNDHMMIKTGKSYLGM